MYNMYNSHNEVVSHLTTLLCSPCISVILSCYRISRWNKRLYINFADFLRLLDMILVCVCVVVSLQFVLVAFLRNKLDIKAWRGSCNLERKWRRSAWWTGQWLRRLRLDLSSRKTSMCACRDRTSNEALSVSDIMCFTIRRPIESLTCRSTIFTPIRPNTSSATAHCRNLPS